MPYISTSNREPREILNIREIYLIRHGETDYNKKGIVQGAGVDASLNKKGQQQAEAFFQAYSHLSFDKIYTSQLKRAYQTIEPFMSFDIPVEKHPGLNEINWGNFEGRPVAQEQHEYYKSLLQSWREGDTHIPIKGGESPEDVAKRQKPVLEKILNKDSHNTILICMHGRAMRILLCQLMNKTLMNMDEFRHGNLSLYHIRFDNIGNSSEIIRSNCTEHLTPLKSETPINA